MKNPTDVHLDPMFSMMQNVNRNLGAMADSMIAVQQSLKRLHSSHTDEQINPKRRKHCSRDEMSASDGSEHDGEDSDADLQTWSFLALKPTELPRINHVLHWSKMMAAMTHCCQKSQRIFSMQTTQVWLLRNSWRTLSTTCGLRNCQTRN